MSQRAWTADRFAQTNAAICAACLHWLCEGYERGHNEAEESPLSIAPVWAMLGLAMLLPEGVRGKLLQRSSRSKLSKLFDDHPEWRAFAADAIRGQRLHFWTAVRFGIATGILTLEHGRLRHQGSIRRPEANSTYADLRARAITLGRLFCDAGGDDAIALIVGIEISI